MKNALVIRESARAGIEPATRGWVGWIGPGRLYSSCKVQATDSSEVE